MKVVREVVLPETITVQELANRMAARTPDVIKTLMRMGVMATITQSLDADTAELVRGYEEVKLRGVHAYRAQRAELGYPIGAPLNSRSSWPSSTARSPPTWMSI